jgi:hypothetical protein
MSNQLMNIDLFLILGAAYEYTREKVEHEDEEARKLRHYIKDGIETYFHTCGYIYESDFHAWKADVRTAEAKKADTARRRTQGAKDGWEIRRGKQKGKQ